MDDPDLLRRRIIHSLISNISLNSGFASAETTAIETLAEMFINCKFYGSYFKKNNS
jgi:hypothetical protein